MKSKILHFVFLILTTISLINLQSCKKDEPEKDKTKPVISLTGSKEMSLILNTEFKDPGFSASDNKDGDITSSVVVTNNVNKDLTGKYEIIYKVSDKEGNEAQETRIVNVYNEANYYTGLYKITLILPQPGGTPQYFQDSIIYSKSINKNIILRKFAGYTNCEIIAKVKNIDLEINQQTINNIGNPPTNVTFNVISTTLNYNQILINFIQSKQGQVSDTGRILYEKI